MTPARRIRLSVTILLLVTMAAIIRWYSGPMAWIKGRFSRTGGPPPPVQFVDVSREAGLTVASHCGGPTKDYIIEAHGTGAAFADYDGDGYLDIYMVVGSSMPYLHRSDPHAPSRLYHNNGNGTFTDMTEKAGVSNQSWGFGCAFGDYDNDGHLDLYVTNYSPNRLYHNNGDGTFRDVTTQAGVGDSSWSTSCVFFDYDRDGYLDLYVTHYIKFDGRYQPRTRFQGIEVYAGPHGFEGMPDRLYHNNGTFTDVTFAANLGTLSLSMLSWGTRFFDYDNDGDQDLFIANGHVYPQVNRFDIGTTYRQFNQLFENLGNGTFAEVSASHGPGFKVLKSSRGACFGDYDNDGDVDVLVVNIDETPTLLRNDGGNRNHWLAIRTVGTKSNRDGIGARIKITAGGRTQVKEVHGGGSYLSHSDLRVYFGLGTNDRVDTIEIRWPSGLIETLHDIAANQQLVVTEGQHATLHPLSDTTSARR